MTFLREMCSLFTERELNNRWGSLAEMETCGTCFRPLLLEPDNAGVRKQEKSNVYLHLQTHPDPLLYYSNTKEVFYVNILSTGRQ